MTVKGTLKYRKVERTPQVGKDAGKKKYYATAVQDRTMEFEDFVTHIAEHNSPYSRGTVHGVLMDTLDCLQELILDGKSVRFSDLGLFSLGMSSRGEETASKVTAQRTVLRTTAVVTAELLLPRQRLLAAAPTPRATIPDRVAALARAVTIADRAAALQKAALVLAEAKVVQRSFD